MRSGSDSLLHALQLRECCAPRPGAAVHAARRACEVRAGAPPRAPSGALTTQPMQRVTPSHTAHVLEHPDCVIVRFTDDGQHLLCFRRGANAPVACSRLRRAG
jgi:hypothetical protein